MITKYSQYAPRLPPLALAHRHQGRLETQGHRHSWGGAQAPGKGHMSPPHLDGLEDPSSFSVRVQSKQHISYAGDSGLLSLRRWSESLGGQCSSGCGAAPPSRMQDGLALPFPRTVAHAFPEGAISKDNTHTLLARVFFKLFFLPLLLGVKYLGKLLQVSLHS